jgi:hypothetical protein
MELSKSKKIIVGIVILALCFLAYKVFISPSGEDLASANSASSGALVGQDILNLLESLKTVTINPEIFTGQAFQNLEDFTIVIQPEPIGRANPFAPIGQ